MNAYIGNITGVIAVLVGLFSAIISRWREFATRAKCLIIKS